MWAEHENEFKAWQQNEVHLMHNSEQPYKIITGTKLMPKLKLNTNILPNKNIVLVSVKVMSWTIFEFYVS